MTREEILKILDRLKARRLLRKYLNRKYFSSIAKCAKKVESDKDCGIIRKDYNPYHDPENGQFTSAEEAGEAYAPNESDYSYSPFDDEEKDNSTATTQENQSEEQNGNNGTDQESQQQEKPRIEPPQEKTARELLSKYLSKGITINRHKQNEHIYGTKEYERLREKGITKSYITVSQQELVNAMPSLLQGGYPIKEPNHIVRVVIEYPKVIGVEIPPGGGNGSYTKYGLVWMDKKRDYHVYPINEATANGLKKLSEAQENDILSKR